MILCVAVSVILTRADVAVTVKIWMKPLTGMKGLVDILNIAAR